MKNKIVVGMGEALWDVLPEGKKIGGAPANFAYHVSQFGLKSCVVSAIGDDALGEVIGVREKSKSLEVISDALAGFNHSKYPWIEWDEATKAGKFLHLPEREDIPENIKEQLIVELYSK